MNHYTHRLVVTKDNTIIKRFYANSDPEAVEKFQLWLIKQGTPAFELDYYIEFVQHANNN